MHNMGYIHEYMMCGYAVWRRYVGVCVIWTTRGTYFPGPYVLLIIIIRQHQQHQQVHRHQQLTRNSISTSTLTLTSTSFSHALHFELQGHLRHYRCILADGFDESLSLFLRSDSFLVLDDLRSPHIYSNLNCLAMINSWTPPFPSSLGMSQPTISPRQQNLEWDTS